MSCDLKYRMRNFEAMGTEKVNTLRYYRSTLIDQQIRPLVIIQTVYLCSKCNTFLIKLFSKFISWFILK